MIIAWMVFLHMSLGSASSSAYEIGDVTCHEGGCLVNGFLFHDYRSGGTWGTDCFEGGCESAGWAQYSMQRGEEYITECDGAGCFKDGYSTFDRFTGAYVGRVVCHAGESDERDCLRHGWTTFSRNWSWITECRGDDCRTKGWRLRMPDGRLQQAVCKEQDCFGKGWVLEQM